MFERPALGGTAGKGMDHGEIAGRGGGHRNARDAFGGRRERGKKCKRKMADGLAKLGAVCAVPGIDGIERVELRDARIVDDAQKVEAGIGNRAGAVGETDQGKQGARRPDFGVIGARGFKSRQGQNDIADGAGANQQAASARH
jgi:hypothetical protein